MAGFHSFAVDVLTFTGALNFAPSCVAEKIAALPLRQPCHATHARPCESVAATGSISAPGAELIRTAVPGLPFSTGRPQISKLPLSFCDQNTHTRPDPSIAIAGR